MTSGGGRLVLFRFLAFRYFRRRMAVDGVPHAVRGTVERVPIQRRRAQTLRLVVVVIPSGAVVILSSPIVIMAGAVVIIAVPIVQTGLAQHALNFFAQRFGNVWSVALAARDAAYVRRVDIEL